MARKGKIIDRVGEKGINNFGSEMIIVEDKGWNKIKVYFEEYNWVSDYVRYDNFKKGSIKCPYERNVYGVGYLGVGKYQHKTHKKIYDTWRLMFRRCYSEEYHKRQPTYKDCEVCEEWRDFQNFAKWYEDNYYEVKNETMCLDKDILVKRNKIYSPYTCIFAPQRINLLFTKNNKRRGNNPIGVFYNKERDKFQACCNDLNGKYKTIGRFNNMNDAFNSYKNFKERVIKDVANLYKGLVPNKLYNAMVNYEVDIDD